MDRPERAGHLARRRDPHDRRRLSLEPTPEAVAHAQEQLRPLEDSLAGLLGGYSDQERQAVARFLREAAALCTAFDVDGPQAQPPRS